MKVHRPVYQAVRPSWIDKFVATFTLWGWGNRWSSDREERSTVAVNQGCQNAAGLSLPFYLIWYLGYIYLLCTVKYYAYGSCFSAHLQCPEYVAVSPVNGDIVVTDFERHSVVFFDKNGRHLAEYVGHDDSTSTTFTSIPDKNRQSSASLHRRLKVCSRPWCCYLYPPNGDRGLGTICV